MINVLVRVSRIHV